MTPNDTILRRMRCILSAMLMTLLGAVQATAGSFILDVDDPDAYVINLGDELVGQSAGENTVEFENGTSPMLSIMTMNGEKLESVTCGDESFKISFGKKCSVTIDESFDGKTIVIRKEGSREMEYTVSLWIDDIDNIDDVWVDGKSQYGLQSGVNTVNAKESVRIRIGGWVEYEDAGVTADGVAVAPEEGSANCYTVPVTGNTEIKVMTMAQETYSFILDVDNASNLSTSRLGSAQIEFTDGVNVVEMKDSTMKLTLKLIDNGKEHEVTLNGEVQDIAYKTPNYYEFNVTTGDEVKVVTDGGSASGDDPVNPGDEEFDSWMTVMIDAASHVTLTVDDREIALRNGSNKVEFNFYDYAYFKCASGWKIKRITVNGEERQSTPAGSGFILEEDLAEASVNITTAPAASSKRTMTIEIDNPANAVVAVEGEPLDMSEGTYVLEYEKSYDELTVTPAEGCRLVSMLEDGEEGYISWRGTYSLYLTDDYGDLPETLSITTENETGVILVEGPEKFDVYTIQGILMKSGAEKTAIDSLPAGLYIINGAKVSIR